jgi:hypothetical protein
LMWEKNTRSDEKYTFSRNRKRTSSMHVIQFVQYVKYGERAL